MDAIIQRSERSEISAIMLNGRSGTSLVEVCCQSKFRHSGWHMAKL
jgi:hypothetical protein